MDKPTSPVLEQSAGGIPPERLAKIEAHAAHAIERAECDQGHELALQDVPALLAEVKRLQAKDRNGLVWEGHLAEGLLNGQDALNEAAAEIESLRERLQAAETRAEMLRVGRDQARAKLAAADALIAELRGGEAS